MLWVVFSAVSTWAWMGPLRPCMKKKSLYFVRSGPGWSILFQSFLCRTEQTHDHSVSYWLAPSSTETSMHLTIWICPKISSSAIRTRRTRRTAIFCTWNAFIRGRLCIGGIDQFPTLPFLTLRLTGGMAPPPCAPLSYASEQHATEDLEKKGGGGGGGEEHACASCSITIMYGQKPPEVQYIRWAGRALAPAANEGSGNVFMTEISVLAV